MVAEELMTIAEVAGRLRCHPKTVRQLIGSGQLQVVILGKTARSWRVHPDDLEAYISSSRKRLECQSTSGEKHGGSNIERADALLGGPLAPPRRGKRKLLNESSDPSRTRASVTTLPTSTH